MKKRNVLFTVVLCLLFTFNPVYGQDVPPQFNTKTEMQQYFKFPVELKKQQKSDIYLFRPYEASSRDGFKPTSPGRRSPYLMRVRSAKLNPSKGGPITNITHIITIPIGKTITVEETTTISRSDTFSASAGISAEFGEKILRKINLECGYEQNRTFTHTITRGESYSYPSKYESYDYVKYYIGFDHDCYDVIVDYVPAKTVQKLLEYTRIEYEKDPKEPQSFTIHFKDGRKRSVSADSLDDFYNKRTVVKDGVRYYKTTEEIYDFDDIITEYHTYKIPVPIEFPIPGRI